MGGGLMQLVAYGAQDIYLTGSPQITFFKVIYRDTPTLLVNPSSKPLTDLSTSATLFLPLSHAMVI